MYSTSGLGATGLYTRRPLGFLVNVLKFIKDEADIHTRILAASSKAFIHAAIKGCLKVKHLTF